MRITGTLQPEKEYTPARAPQRLWEGIYTVLAQQQLAWALSSEEDLTTVVLTIGWRKICLFMKAKAKIKRLLPKVCDLFLLT